MALGRKGARRIVVDGTAYRWRLRRRPTYFQALAWTPCTFAVEHADAPATTLVVTTNQPHPSNWFGREANPVLPSDVVHAIELALREGLDPDGSGLPVLPGPVRRLHTLALNRSKGEYRSARSTAARQHRGTCGRAVRVRSGESAGARRCSRAVGALFAPCKNVIDPNVP